MKAVVYEAFQGALSIQDVSAPRVKPHGAILRVQATGICMSDWHGWMGHDSGISLPHVPGHEFAGVIAEVGSEVRRWKPGDRVTVPFVCACGNCPECLSGNQQVCDHQEQPGFTHWGSFAEYVHINQADLNLVLLPEAIDFTTAASLGCRFTTSFRAVVDQAKVRPGEWVAVHGCGGVGLSAVMIAAALGAHVVGIDINPEKLAFARSIGAREVIDARQTSDIPEAVRELTAGGAHVSLDALGSPQTCFNSVAGLRKRGRHVQVGLMSPADAHSAIPVDLVISKELEILGSHGMQAHRFGALLEMMLADQLHPGQLIGKRITLEESLNQFSDWENYKKVGITVIDRI
ncbi:MAG: alcohol dehydrogenase [Anaerolineae bacterium UTCFX2]|jgi:alcohol dehydrogenase|nr:zinc-dependent alcohol dehydrogenase family protein [Anaerolineales bacterium]OQY87950.1 MAG: alcohol dehydrogenase [Anaerolineae bacterium UTCFX2]